MKKFRLVALCAVLAILTGGVVLPSVAQASGLFSTTQVIFDEEVAVSAHGTQMRSFKLNRGATLQVETKGLKHTDKGYDVYVMTPADYEKFTAGKEFRHFQDFHGLKITGATKTHDLQAGEYAVVIHNKYNLMNGMTVHIKATLNP